ncbi:AbrB/MazE/SpoVT family DNA-binding domain-containing protein [Sinorhizobium meliloti WSM1022]|uniref:AbrB/MazE/SpoVT family DNA-binding domain-containing protein n=1 Tax=Rhizobium meliloti TaxID=382 RepID=UPI0003F591D8|nr:AbrB/MazE/SpoVT family DNA-binding domain-containing protein [Sinorhizobium meliloti]ASQ04081.1 AbrB family transcriptional regulator [Sinorhizobium meliloti]MCO6424892.1 AbrB/MazE/SpoVT family DNA-binding domain-containing protein [Sinorhizobium meliloti]MDW9409582.1 AbrB/MazE/SpoVT family DNA-binding domain-containing protein [Sinorhizobium meliloti]MDW9440942.1 AbrB/MazE/SpoVT family DNA-binding domain-containing protein [Sinorhizobium meliloti]MDW9454956.1 AbrB/MazE/SpoVT family DNA-bin
MPTSTITSKGQITIPAKVRTDMGLSAGDRVDFIRMEDGHYAVVPASHSIRSLKGIVPRPDRPVSLEDMQKAIIAGAAGE